MATNNVDSALTATYQEFNVPVDQFFADGGLTQAFVAAVGERLKDADLDPQKVMRRLLNLRKRGRLPRLRRSYYGRGASDN